MKLDDEAIARARRWLKGVRPQAPQSKALRSLGLLCCERLRARSPVCRTGKGVALQLPPIYQFVTMDRANLSTLCGSVALTSSRGRLLSTPQRRKWSEAFGSVALSFARVGDPSTAAALLRAAAQLKLSHPWLDETERFLLDQQTPEGCFGFFAREAAILGGQDYSLAHLSLSAEILWALAEVYAARR